ncbi:MAG: hypothetical protein J6T27_03480 [Alphaproteobacteria bacterium]|nr:hypothetical protein [Alphaproteobacteria bacterium]
MKIKIRGLVFVGFAAAVFASSARAAVPNDQVPGVTVTSRAYTEKTYEHKPEALTVDGTQIEEAVWIGWNESQTGVAPQADSGKQWTKLQGRNYTQVVNDKDGHYVQLRGSKITTSGAQIAAADANNSNTADDLTDLPNVNAVKEYVDGVLDDGAFQPEVAAPHWNSSTNTIDHDTRNIIQVGQWTGTINESTGEVTTSNPTWANFVAQPDSQQNGSVTSLGYLTIGQQVGGGFGNSYNINIAGTKIADEASEIAAATGSDVSVNNKLTTAKAVYDYINGDPEDPDSGFQRKLTTDEAEDLAVTSGDAGVGVGVGYRSYNSEAASGSEYGDSTWMTFRAKPNANNVNLEYLQIEEESRAVGEAPQFLISVKQGTVAKDATAISDASASASYTYKDKLATAGAVNAYAVQKDWSSVANSANKTLVTDANGIVTLSDVPVIPGTDTMPSECHGANATAHCALVSKWVDAQGTNGQEDYVAAHLELTWTVMADQTD